MRRASFDGRVKQIIEENKRNSISSMIIFTVYTFMLIRYSDDMWAVHREYPEVVYYLISATGATGFECFWQIFTATMFTFEYGVKACTCSWVLIVALQAHTYWGVTHVFSSKFKAM